MNRILAGDRVGRTTKSGRWSSPSMGGGGRPAPAVSPAVRERQTGPTPCPDTNKRLVNPDYHQYLSRRGQVRIFTDISAI
jgi:hypothetical protein